MPFSPPDPTEHVVKASEITCSLSFLMEADRRRQNEVNLNTLQRPRSLFTRVEGSTKLKLTTENDS